MAADERLITKFSVIVKAGLTHEVMADELERVAGLLREGYQQGEVVQDAGSGWWDSSE